MRKFLFSRPTDMMGTSVIRDFVRLWSVFHIMDIAIWMYGADSLAVIFSVSPSDGGEGVQIAIALAMFSMLEAMLLIATQSRLAAIVSVAYNGFIAIAAFLVKFFLALIVVREGFRMSDLLVLVEVIALCSFVVFRLERSIAVASGCIILYRRRSSGRSFLNGHRKGIHSKT